MSIETAKTVRAVPLGAVCVGRVPRDPLSAPIGVMCALQYESHAWGARYARTVATPRRPLSDLHRATVAVIRHTATETQRRLVREHATR